MTIAMVIIIISKKIPEYLKLSKISEIGFILLNDKDVVRHELVKKIINAYDNFL